MLPGTVVVLVLAIMYGALSVSFALSAISWVGAERLQVLLSPFTDKYRNRWLSAVLTVEFITELFWVIGVYTLDSANVSSAAAVALSMSIGWLFAVMWLPRSRYQAYVLAYTGATAISYVVVLVLAFQDVLPSRSPTSVATIIAISLHTAHRGIVDIVWACQMNQAVLYNQVVV